MNNAISDFIIDGLPYCSSAFPLCSLLLGVLPPPDGLDTYAAAALACVFCLLAVVFLNVSFRATYSKSDVVVFMFFYVIFGGLLSLFVLIGLINSLNFIPLGFGKTSHYVGFFVGLSWLFTWLKNIAIMVGEK